MAKKKRTQKETQEVLLDLVKGVGGGYAAGLITNEYEKTLIKNKKPTKNAPIVGLLASVLLAMFGGRQLRPVAVGMAAMSGAEIIPNLMNRKNANLNNAPLPPPPADTPTNAATQRVNAATQRVNNAANRINMAFEKSEMSYGTPMMYN